MKAQTTKTGGKHKAATPSTTAPRAKPKNKPQSKAKPATPKTPARAKAAPQSAPKTSLRKVGPKLTMGPLYFHWDAAQRRDFYLRLADDPHIDCVYLGEVVCSKREAFFIKDIDHIIDRLEQAGKEVIRSTLALVTTDKESAAIQTLSQGPHRIEANDVAAVHVLQGKDFVVGPFINVLNEGARDFVVRCGARRIVLPVEITTSAVKTIAQKPKGAKTMPEIEVQVFGRQALSVSMRCYHARAHGRDKDHCQIACAADADGLEISSFGGDPILTVNGTSVLSHGYAALFKEMNDLKNHGVTHFRLSPHAMDMAPVTALFRAVLTDSISPDSALDQLRALMPKARFINGFMHTRAGKDWAA